MKNGDKTELSHYRSHILGVHTLTTVNSLLEVGKTEHSLGFNLSNNSKPTLTSAPDVRNPGGKEVESPSQTQGHHAPAEPQPSSALLSALLGYSQASAVSEVQCCLQTSVKHNLKKLKRNKKCLTIFDH